MVPTAAIDDIEVGVAMHTIFTLARIAALVIASGGADRAAAAADIDTEPGADVDATVLPDALVMPVLLSIIVLTTRRRRTFACPAAADVQSMKTREPNRSRA